MQSWGPLNPQQWAGVHVPVNAPNEFVLQPLTQATAGDADLASALTTYRAASSDQQQKWLTAYATGARHRDRRRGRNGDRTLGDYGPVSVLMDRMLTLARSGGLDALLLTSNHFYQTDFTRPLLFLDDGGYIANLATQQKLIGSDWGVMNETGRYPGSAWLWLYTMWYQIPPFNSDTGFLGISAANTDLAVVGVMLAPHGPALPGALHPGPPRHPALDPDPQADLAASLRGDAAGRRRAEGIAGTETRPKGSPFSH